MPKKAYFGQDLAIFGPKILIFWEAAKVLLPSVKNRIFGPKTRPNFAQNMLSWAHVGLAGSFGALLVGRLVVLARGLYLARHLSTLYLFR